MRDRCAVLRTLLQCVCTQRRNCIGQLSPFSEYAPTALRNKWKPATTIKLIHYRRLGAKLHESSASGGYLGIQCLQRFQSLDATHDWDYSRAANVARARQLLAVPVRSDQPDTSEAPAPDEPRMLPRPCPCCGGRMIIIETFAPGCEPNHRPTPSPAAIGIDTS